MTALTNPPTKPMLPAGKSRRPVEKLLPRSVQAAIRERLRQAGPVTAELLDEITRRHDLDTAYGLSKRRIRSFLVRLHVAAGDPQRNAAGEDPPTEPSWERQLQAHRARQASVASILDATFGKLAQCSPDLWGYRAYLMLIGLVYDRLAANEEGISTTELVALAKVIAENRRLEVRLREAADEAKADSSPTRSDQPLPQCLQDVVRQVYGTNLQTP
jgi:hypothetical protein